VEIVSVVLLTPLKFGKNKISWCPFEIFHFAITVISAVSMTPLKSIQPCQWHQGNCFSGVNYTAELVSAVSMTQLNLFQRCQWHRWNSNIIDFLGEYKAIWETALGRESGP
jgi:hypothetical protein